MGKFTFRFEAGAFIRGKIKREIEKGAFDAGLQLNIEESKGFLESMYFVTATGPDLKVAVFADAVREFFNASGAEID